MIINNYDKLNGNERYEFLHFLSHGLWDSVVNLQCLCKKDKAYLTFHSNLTKMHVSYYFVRRLNELIILLNKEGYKIKDCNSNKFTDFITCLIDVSFEIYNLVTNCLGLKRENLTISKFEDKKYSSDEKLIFVKKFKKAIDKIEGVKLALLQGSLSTLDYTGFSDFDTFIILNKRLLHDPEDLIKTIFELYKNSVFFYLFDPLQHHRYFFAFEQDLQCYNQSFLPTEVWKHATILKGASPIEVNSYNSIFSHNFFITGSIEYFLKQKRNNYDIKNYWYLKYFVSMIFFLPVLWLETNGEYVYKRESFTRIRDLLPKSLSEYLDLCSEIRAQFKYNPSILERLLGFLFLKFLKNPMLYEYLMSKFSRCILYEDYKKIFEQSSEYVFWFKNKLLFKRQYLKCI